MSNTITTLTNLLHKFNSQTIQRSLDYVSHIDLDSLDRTETADTIVLKADVEGSEDNIYRTSVTFNKQNHRIIDSHCSCPVGSFCKHGGALARLLRDRESHALTVSQIHSLKQAKTIGQSGLLQNFLQSMVDNANLAPNQQKSMDKLLIEAQRQKAEPLANPLADPVFNKRAYDDATRWLKNLQDSLEKNAKTVAKAQNSPTDSPFIYLIEQVFDNLRLHVMKVRRNKAGEIRDTNNYTQFQNIANGNISVSNAEKVLFSKIYTHAKAVNEIVFYTPYLIANDLPVEFLKELILTKNLFSQKLWEANKLAEQTHPLTWTEDSLTLNIEWQETAQSNVQSNAQNNAKNSEKLNFYLSNDQAEIIPLKQNGNHQLLFTQPLTYLDKNSRQIGQVYTATLGEIPNDVLYRLMTMPSLPSELVTEVDEVFSKSPATQQLPKPKAVQNLENLYGTPQPIVHFSTADDINVPWQYRSELRDGTWIQKKLVLAELSFAYEGGETVANTDEFFIGKKNGNKVRQYQDKDFEKQAIKQFRNMFSSFNWLKNGMVNSKFKAVIEVSEVLSALLPTDKIADSGWQVEHLPDSPVNVQPTHNMELHLAEINDTANSEHQGNQWFEVGATVSDSEGHRYDLLSIVAHLLEQFPFLFNKNIEQLLDKNHLFAVEVGGGKPALAISFGDILPILQNLTHLLSQDDRKLDRYDVAQLFDLEHTLGMAWQTSNKLKNFAEKLKAGYQSSLPTPKGFMGELRPYQQQGLAWLQFLVATEHGGILADDMGLGKTAQTLAHVLMEKQAGQLKNKPVLIVAPTSLMHNWQIEAEKFTPTLKVLLLHGANRHEDFDKILQSDIVLTTYPLVVRDEEILKQHQFHQIILDEAQNIKNPRSKSAHTLRMLNATHRLCLTGTPMENHLGELWSLFYFLMPGFLGSQEGFNKQYRHPIEKKGDNQKRQRLVNRTKPFILRRLKTDVAKELPPKTTIEVNIDMNDEQSKLYEAVRATMQSTIKQIIAEQGFKRSQIQILDALLKLRQVCCHPSLLNLESLPNAKKSSKTKVLSSAKLDYLIETVSDMVAEGRKILIFSQFTSMLALIEEKLNEQDIAFSKLIGQTKKRSEAIEAFQSGQVPVFLISLKAGGVGLNLTTADTVIHYDPWWNPATEDQASDRAWRIGQDKPVFVYKLITNQSIEEKILLMQKNKALLAKSILSTDHEGEVKLSEEALLGLFEKMG